MHVCQLAISTKAVQPPSQSHNLLHKTDQPPTFLARFPGALVDRAEIMTNMKVSTVATQTNQIYSPHLLASAPLNKIHATPC